MHIASPRRESSRRSNLRATAEPTSPQEHAAAHRQQATLTPRKLHDAAMSSGTHVKPSSNEGSPAFAGLPRETPPVFESNGVSNTGRSAPPSCRNAECSSDRAAAQTRRSRRSVRAPPPTRLHRDILRLPSSCLLSVRFVSGSTAAPARGSAVSQVLLAIARCLPAMLRAGGGRDARQGADRQAPM